MTRKTSWTSFIYRLRTMQTQAQNHVPTLLILCIMLGFSGCRDSVEPTSLFGLQTTILEINGHRVNAELAYTPEVSARGLMFRDKLDETSGMLFDLGGPRQASFYMKNTRIPLSIAYLNADGTIAEIYDMHPLNLTPIESTSDRITHALEVNQGWFSKNNIKVGAKVLGIPKE